MKKVVRLVRRLLCLPHNLLIKSTVLEVTLGTNKRYPGVTPETVFVPDITCLRKFCRQNADKFGHAGHINPGVARSPVDPPWPG